MDEYEDFKGKIGRTYKESTPWWPEPKEPERNQPNIIMILFDDTGFSSFGCYGSSIDTPNIDRLANEGLRYTSFHTTALCSPTRACLLTGRNHHTVGVGRITNMSNGFPHTRGYITPRAATIAEILRENGYSTFHTGKWHLAPMTQGTAAGPFDHWPLQRGFNRYYGFLDGETDQFYPQLYYDNHPVNPPKSPEEGYHVTEDIIDKSIEFIRDHKSIYPAKPFFLYAAFGATHQPHQAPREFIDKYKGRFDAGWDEVREEWYNNQIEMGVIPPGTKLAPHNRRVEPWETLSDKEKRFALKLQEAFAGFLDHTDHHIGRLLDFLDEMKLSEDTIVVLASDNGASGEAGPLGLMNEQKNFAEIPEDLDEVLERVDEIGGPNSYPNYPMGWAQAANAPLKWYKAYTYGGGIRDACIIRWPVGIKDQGGIRNQFHHVTDIVPTILEVLNITAPTTYKGYGQLPISGTSMAYTFDSADEPSRKDVQYFEMFGRRGIWKDGWKAVTQHRKGFPYSDEEWRLYNLDEDFSEHHDLAEECPEKLKELIDLWWVEAGKHGVLPLDDRDFELFSQLKLAGTPHSSQEYTYHPPISLITGNSCPPVGGRSWDMTAEINRTDEGQGGVIFARGSHNNGMACYIMDNRLVFDYNMYREHHVVRSDRPIPLGECVVEVHFRREDRKGNVTLLIDGEKCGSLQTPFVLTSISSTGLQIGKNNLSPLSNDYETPFEFGGKLKEVKIKVLDPIPTQEELRTRFREEMAKQ